MSFWINRGVLPQCDYFFILINFLKVLLTSRKMQLLASNPQISEVSSLLGGYPVVSLLSYLSLLTQMLLECICTHNKQTFSTLYTQWRRRLHYSFSGSHSFKETSIMTPIFWQPWLERKGSFLVRKKSESLTFFFPIWRLHHCCLAGEAAEGAKCRALLRLWHLSLQVVKNAFWSNFTAVFPFWP